MDRLWTVSNVLSIVRVVLAVPVAFLVISGDDQSRTVAVVLIAIAALTDFLDGFLARRLREVTNLGKILDPLADKLALGIVGIVLAWKGLIPTWFVAAVVCRDLLILAGGLILTRKARVLPQSNWFGKWTAAVIALIVFLSLFDPGRTGVFMPWLLGLGACMLCISLVLYARRMFAAPQQETGT